MKIIGAQLYTVREQLDTEEQAVRTVAQVKALGYDTVQLFGDVETARRCALACGQVGMPIAGILTDLENCEQSGEKLFELCRIYGIRDIGISSGPLDAAAAAAFIPRVNAFARRTREAGFSFSYHNHGHEFIRTAFGKTVMELFLEGFDPETVDFMPDTYWVHDGGFDVRRFLELVRGRVKILHLKDMKRTPEGHTFAEVGSGNLYFPGILQLAEEIGVQQLVVEQDFCDGDPLESLKTSIGYLRSIT